MSLAYHPQSNRQSERTIQTLEDMLRACCLDWKGSWAEYVPLAEFIYNNSYQASIGMAPFEALYGHPCRSPLCLEEVGDRLIQTPELVQQCQERVVAVRQRLLTAQSRQKSYADIRRKDLEFAAGDFVWLKISPMKGVVRFGKRGKWSLRYIGPFEILSRVGDCAYQLALPI